MKSQNADAIETIDEYYPSCVSTGINNNVTTSEIKKIEYFTIGGAKLNNPAKGLNIRKITYTSGKTMTDKVIK